PPPPGPEERARRTGAQEPVTVPGPGDGAAEPADRAGSVPSPQPAIEVSPPPAAGVATGALETPAAETARRILDEVLAEHERTLQEAPPTSPDTPALDDGGDADGDDEPGDGLDESAGDDAVTAALFPAAEADPGPAHAPEGPDDPATPSSTTDALFVAAPSDGAQERTAARLVADTLEPPAVAEPGPVTAGAEHDATHAGDGSYEPDEATPDEVTVDGSHAPDEVTAQAHWPQDTPPRRTGRWLVVTIVGAVALAYLFPMAVGAFRELVSLS
ncbi:MAG: hypothetical protein JJT89_14210, partial [Nitriliruptoraceae bacterium]|nr:hypothetical protein [Nitriliruptoraceae bacterium]